MSQDGNYGVAMAIILLAVALLILFVVMLWGVSPAKSEEEFSEISVTNAAFCSLHARQMVFSEMMHGPSMTADTDVILARAKQHYSDCLAVLPSLMPLPADTGSLRTWLADIRDLLVLRGAERVASIGTVPASEDPDDAAWREACRSEYLTWSEADATVIRNGSPDRVPCPLILENGKWVIPGSQEVTSSP